jgi:hypothetical protein
MFAPSLKTQSARMTATRAARLRSLMPYAEDDPRFVSIAHRAEPKKYAIAAVPSNPRKRSDVASCFASTCRRVSIPLVISIAVV